MPVPDGAMLEYHRADQTARLRRILVTGASILTAGGLVIAVSFLARPSQLVRQIAAVIGLGFTIAGALSTILRMHAALRDDAWIAATTSGIVVHDGEETFLAWDDIERVRCDAEAQTIVLDLREGPARVIERRFGPGPAELAKRLDDLRRKASFSLLR